MVAIKKAMTTILMNIQNLSDCISLSAIKPSRETTPFQWQWLLMLAVSSRSRCAADFCSGLSETRRTNTLYETQMGRSRNLRRAWLESVDNDDIPHSLFYLVSLAKSGTLHTLPCDILRARTCRARSRSAGVSMSRPSSEFMRYGVVIPQKKLLKDLSLLAYVHCIAPFD